MNFDTPRDDKPNGRNEESTSGQTGSPPASAHRTAPARGTGEREAAGEKSRFSLPPVAGEPKSAGRERREWAPHSVQDQERHGLELVTSAAAHQEPSSGDAEEAHSEQELHAETAARLMQAIEDELDQIRRGAGRVIEFQPGREGTLQRISARLGRAFSRLKGCTRQIAQEKPLRIVAKVLLLGLAVGAALRLRRAGK